MRPRDRRARRASRSILPSALGTLSGCGLASQGPRLRLRDRGGHAQILCRDVHTQHALALVTHDMEALSARDRARHRLTKPTALARHNRSHRWLRCTRWAKPWKTAG